MSQLIILALLITNEDLLAQYNIQLKNFTQSNSTNKIHSSPTIQLKQLPFLCFSHMLRHKTCKGNREANLSIFESTWLYFKIAWEISKSKAYTVCSHPDWLMKKMDKTFNSNSKSLWDLLNYTNICDIKTIATTRIKSQ